MKQVDKLKTRLELADRYIKKMETNRVRIKNSILHLKELCLRHVCEVVSDAECYKRKNEIYEAIKLCLNEFEEN